MRRSSQIAAISATSIRSAISTCCSCASKLNLKIVEVPIRYANRTYGETCRSQGSAHGWLLMRMVFFAWRKLKAF